MEKPESLVAKTASRAHAALLADLRILETAVNAQPAPAVAELRAYLSTTRIDLAEHFRTQEHDGDMDTIQTQQPRLAPAIHQLADEHHELTHGLDTLIAEAAAARTLNAALCTKVRDWIGRVRRHEIHEVDFIQDAFDRDIGVKD